MNKKYDEKLKHPFWQRKRLEIFNLHNFTCQNCSAKENTLHIHHTYYEKNKEPWEYENDSLKCLCDKCHKKWHIAENILNDYILKIKKSNSFDLLFYAGLLAGFTQNKTDISDIEVLDDQFATGLGIYFNKNLDEIKKNLDGNILRKEILIHWENRFELLFEDGVYSDIEVLDDQFATGLGIYFNKNLDEIKKNLDGNILRKEILIHWENLREGNDCNFL